MEKLQPGLSNNQLKLIAMATMVLDHVGLMLLPELPLLRVLGRVSFPIFAYMIAEGCAHTRSRTAYFWKLAGLAAACQIVFALSEGSCYMGILVTFSLSVLTIFTVDAHKNARSAGTLAALAAVIAGVLFLTIAAPLLWMEYGFQVDYGLPGVLLPVTVYYLPEKREKLLCAGCILAAMGLIFGGLQWFGLLALPLLWLYNQRRGRARLKYLFYIFYPAHLVMIWLIGMVTG